MSKAKKYVVFKAAGAQHRVAEGEELDLFRLRPKDDGPLAHEEGQEIIFDEVLLVKDGDKVKVGQPSVKGVSVKATVVKHFRGKKLRVATYKAKSRYRRVLGHRDELTRVKVMGIDA